MLPKEHEPGGDDRLPALPVAGRGRSLHAPEIYHFFLAYDIPPGPTNTLQPSFSKLFGLIFGWMLPSLLGLTF